MVVGEYGALGVLRHSGGTEVTSGGEDRVVRVVGILAAVVIGVHAVGRPGGWHELHPALRAGGGGTEVLAETALDLVDRGEDRRPGGAEVIGLCGGLVDGAEEGWDGDRPARGGHQRGGWGGAVPSTFAAPFSFSPPFGFVAPVRRRLLRRLVLWPALLLGVGSRVAGSAPAAPAEQAARGSVVVVVGSGLSGRGLRRGHGRGDRRAHDRRCDDPLDPSHQPRTWATRHSSPVFVSVRRTSLIARSRTSETLAVTCSLPAAPSTTFRTRARGTLLLAGSRGGSLASVFASGFVAVALKATLRLLAGLSDLVTDEGLGELPGDLGRRRRGLGGRLRRGRRGMPGLELGSDPLQSACVGAGGRRRHGSGRKGVVAGGIMARGADRPTSRRGDGQSHRAGGDRRARHSAPPSERVPDRPGEPGLDQPLEGTHGPTRALDRVTGGVAASPQNSLLEAPCGLADSRWMKPHP